MQPSDPPGPLRFGEGSACPACAADRAEPRFRSPDFLHGVPGEFQYVECRVCGTFYQSPRVVDEDLLRCYPSAYFTRTLPALPPAHDSRGALRDQIRRGILLAADGGADTDLPTPWAVLGRLLARIAALRRRARFGLVDGLGCPRGGTPARCLEVGPGQGIRLKALRALGWNAVGLDLDPVAAATAGQVSGCTVEVGTLQGAPFPNEHFDLIHMNHVVEHLPDLGPSLKRCFELLTTAGRLVLVYPNPRALTARVFGRYSCVWDPPRHLALPPQPAMVALLRRVGFNDITASTIPWRAAAYRHVSRAYRQAGPGAGLPDAPSTLGDRAFALVEAVLVWAGLGVGEEIVVAASKATRGRQ